MSKSLLELRRLTVEFSQRQETTRAVDGIDLDVAQGEIVGLVGESGSGKTLTALAIGGLLPVQARWKAERLQLHGNGRIGYIFQDPSTSLNPVLTIREQLLEALLVQGDLPRAQANSKLLEALRAVQISDPQEKLAAYPHQLSGGMQQRVMLAMAVLLEPSLLVADEPTTALDITVQRQILALLLQLRAQKNLGILLITHDLLQVARIADRLCVMHQGRIVETGPTQQIVRSPTNPYTRMLLGAT